MPLFPSCPQLKKDDETNMRRLCHRLWSYCKCWEQQGSAARGLTIAFLFVVPISQESTFHFCGQPPTQERHAQQGVALESSGWGFVFGWGSSRMLALHVGLSQFENPNMECKVYFETTQKRYPQNSTGAWDLSCFLFLRGGM